MNRVVEPELLDHLPPDDPMAIRSRLDLRRLNRLMGHASFVVSRLKRLSSRPERIAEIGAGDGHFALNLARRLGPEWRGTEMVLVDRIDIVADETRRRFEDLGWRIHVVQDDALNWLATTVGGGRCVVANLFLHHFDDARLRRLLTAVARAADGFIASEPRRSPAVLAVSRLCGWIGCNSVTRHDAAASVRAGFLRCEISALWPATESWRTEESDAGAFSHCFEAVRGEVPVRIDGVVNEE
jgi:hypothetical protein